MTPYLIAWFMLVLSILVHTVYLALRQQHTVAPGTLGILVGVGDCRVCCASSLVVCTHEPLPSRLPVIDCVPGHAVQQRYILCSRASCLLPKFVSHATHLCKYTQAWTHTRSCASHQCTRMCAACPTHHAHTLEHLLACTRCTHVHAHPAAA